MDKKNIELLKVIKPAKLNESFIDNENYCIHFETMKDKYRNICKFTKKINKNVKHIDVLNNLTMNKLGWFLDQEADICKRIKFLKALLKEITEDNYHYRVMEEQLEDIEYLQQYILPLAKELFKEIQDFDFEMDILKKIESEIKMAQENEME